MLSARQAILGAMCLRPNMVMSIHHIQRSVFLVEVGVYGDPTTNRTGFGFLPGTYGPVSHEVFNEICQLARERSIAALSGIGMAMYISMESGYAEGLSILSSMTPARRHGVIETVTWVNNSTIEEMAASFRQHYPEFCESELQEEEK